MRLKTLAFVVAAAIGYAVLKEFLRSVPPVRHRVNNGDPPTYCPRCGRRHGLGELNSP
jgi:hypothetical protein